MKKKRVILISIILPVLVAALCASGGGETPITVHGSLSAKDVSRIRRIVRQDMLLQILPGLSWESVKGIPGRVKDYLKFKFQGMDASSDGPVEVWLELQSYPDDHHLALVKIYKLGRESGAWKIIPPARIVATP